MLESKCARMGMSWKVKISMSMEALVIAKSAGEAAIAFTSNDGECSMPDIYTSAGSIFQGQSPGKREMICTRCRGNFAGDDANLFHRTDPYEVVALCDNCIRELGHA